MNNQQCKMIGMGRLLAVLLMLLLLSACQGKQNDLSQYVNSVIQRPAEPIEPIPPILVSDSFIYDPTDLRDPFLVQVRNEDIAGGPGDGPRPDPDRRKEYLERFPLDTLDMVGTLARSESENWGLIQDTDGVVHRVSENNYMGQNHGRVSAVLADRVIMIELLPDGNGGWLEREASLSIEEQP